MKKIRNKFIIFIIFSIIIVLLIWIYNSFFNKVDRNTYAVLMEGQWIVNNKLLKREKKELLNIWDVVRTIWDSLLVIEWWDWSVTRLWSDSMIKINELYVQADLLKINVSFDLLSWKSWTNVLNFLWTESYFKESFRDLEAWVRWTVFNVDLDNEYITVLDHKIFLSWDDVNLIIEENRPFSLKTFSFLNFEEFIQKIKDYDFESLNMKLDEELFKSLREKVHEKLDKYFLPQIENISELTTEKKEELYNKLLPIYQELNFISSEDWKLFSKKIEIKEKLIELASYEEKENLIKSIINDFVDSVKSENYEELDNIMSILLNNVPELNNIDFDFENFFTNLVVKEKLEKILIQNLDYMTKLLWDKFDNVVWDLDLEELNNLYEDSKDLYNNSQVKETINEQVGFIKQFLEWLLNFFKIFII